MELIRTKISRESSLAEVPDCPYEYAIQKGRKVTPQQKEILQASVQPPYSTIVRSAHTVGKTFLAAMFLDWFYDRFNPSVALTTAPNKTSVEDLLFKELRALKANDPGWYPKAPRIQSSPNHFIHGLTASTGEAFQGRHDSRLAIVFDEAAGIDAMFWNRAETMAERGRPGHFFLAFFNPYDTSCPAFFQEQRGVHTVKVLSALDHPNVVTGQDIIPGAISRATVLQRIHEECRKLREEDEKPSSAFCFEGQWYVPENPLFEVAILGRWPSTAINSVWSERAIEFLLTAIKIDPLWTVQIGCDPARFGNDRTAICVRKGQAIVHLEWYNGLDTEKTATRLKELCVQYAQPGQPAKTIPVLIDGGGIGGGVVDQRGKATDRFNFVEINSGMSSRYEADFRNLRSELWFSSKDLADVGQLSIASLPADTKALLLNELRMPVYILDSFQRRVVESKDQTKIRLKRSPDLADAFNLACLLPVGTGWNEQVQPWR